MTMSQLFFMRGMVAPVGDEKTPGTVSVPLVEGIAVTCAMPNLDGSVELGVEHEGKRVKSERIRPEDPPKPFSIDLGMIEVDLELNARNDVGLVTGRGTIRLDDPLSDRGKTVAEIDKDLFHYAPAHGAVGDRTEPDPPIFDDKRFGRTRMSSKDVTRVFVDDNQRVLADVGRVVKKLLWDDYPDWTFNTVACVGEFDGDGRGTYSNPGSIWFNVFLGYYQIDAPKPDWDRPFAYESAKGAKSEVRFDEIVRLGKTDWNYISNWMYGVPGEVVRRYNDLEMEKVKTSQEEASQIGSSRWHRVGIGNVAFVSAYESDAPGSEDLTDNSLVSDAWRKAFGTPSPHPEYSQSFIPTRTDADMFISYWEDDEAFHTVIFGGTAPNGSDPAFLGRQMEEAGKVIKRGFPDLGFPLK